MSTSGWGQFTFDSYAKSIAIQGKNLVPFNKVAVSSVLESKQRVANLVKQEVTKATTGKPVNAKTLAVK